MDIKEYFNDKINWKFLNYICDKATKFEDEKNIRFEVGVYIYDNNYEPIFKYSTRGGYEWNTYEYHEPEHNIKKYEQRKELVYAVLIRRTKNFDIYTYYSTIKHRADLITYDMSVSTIMDCIVTIPDKNFYK